MRTAAVVLAAAVAVVVPVQAPAGAAPSAPVADPSAAPAPKPQRPVVAEGKGSGTSDIRVKAHVKGRPLYANRFTALQRKDCRSCAWEVVRQRRTGDNAFVTYRVDAPATGQRFFRVRVPETRDYRVSYSNVLVASRDD